MLIRPLTTHRTTAQNLSKGTPELEVHKDAQFVDPSHVLCDPRQAPLKAESHSGATLTAFDRRLEKSGTSDGTTVGLETPTSQRRALAGLPLG